MTKEKNSLSLKQKLVCAKMPIAGRERIVSVLYENDSAVEIHVNVEEKPPIAGNIYVGRVTSVVQGGVFVRFDKEHIGFLSSQRLKNAILKNGKDPKEVKPEDILLVMVRAEASHNKPESLSGELSIAGRNIVAGTGIKGIAFSSKLEKNIRSEFLNILKEEKLAFGIIVRTAARETPIDEIISEAKFLTEELKNIVEYGFSRPDGTCLFKQGGIWLQLLLKCPGIFEVVTDISAVYEELESYTARIRETLSDKAAQIRLYEDNLLPLYRRNGISALLDQALSERVWLKSGAFLVIQKTEAFTCIDVNSGKAFSDRKDNDFCFTINHEAALEAARQIRLRQLSGTILIDFINMYSDELEERLIDVFKDAAANDPAKVIVHDVTALGIMEITRQKRYKSLREQLS